MRARAHTLRFVLIAARSGKMKEAAENVVRTEEFGAKLEVFSERKFLPVGLEIYNVP